MAKTAKRVFILVKAYPQPSRAYQETVCCAGITETGEFVRLYPIRYRRLKPEARFERYDLVQVEGEKPRDDHRPESFHVDEDSIRIVRTGRSSDANSKPLIWLPYVSPSLDALRGANDDPERRTSLGIVMPDAGSVRFSWKPTAAADEADQAISASLQHQSSLIEDPLEPLDSPEYVFRVSWTSNGRKSEGAIHDWEVQAAYRAYKRKYHERALDMMKQQYQEEMAGRNLHFFLGTMKAHPKQFIIVGLLRSSPDVASQRPLL